MATGDIVDEHLIENLFELRSGHMNAVVFASGSGTNFREAVLESRKPGSNYSIDLLITDKEHDKGEDQPIGAIQYGRRFEIPIITVDGFQYCGSWQEAKKTITGREEYERRADILNQKFYNMLTEYEREHDVVFDLAILAGYMRFFKGALLKRFYRRGVNVHPAKLYEFNAVGKRKYRGEKAVIDALDAGEKKTRSSIILIDEGNDEGPILVSGPWIEYTGNRPVTTGDAEQQQGEQKKASDWPALRFALREIANGNFGLHKRKFHHDGNPVVVYKGIEMPYQGYDMDG
ncbi:MAG: hypothetical protein HY514_03515 [Candidatus Aenigmarchaeota archaeon]|nr:hypothetical protein [Candidatus Aenigmarchaeota archaeon]